MKITKYFNHEPTFNGVLPRMKNRMYVLIPDDKQSKETHWV